MAFLSTPGGRFLAGLLIVILLVGGAYAYGDHRGYGRAETAYKAAAATEQAQHARDALDELHRQIDANATAKADEAKRLADDQAKEAELSNLREELQREAHQDPAAGQPALGAGSVQRVNKVR